MKGNSIFLIVLAEKRMYKVKFQTTGNLIK